MCFLQAKPRKGWEKEILLMIRGHSLYDRCVCGRLMLLIFHSNQWMHKPFLRHNVCTQYVIYSASPSHQSFSGHKRNPREHHQSSLSNFSLFSEVHPLCLESYWPIGHHLLWQQRYVSGSGVLPTLHCLS